MGEKKIESFILYCNWEKSFSELTKDDQANLIMAIFAYVNRGELPNFPRGSGVSLVFGLMKDTLDTNRKKYEARCEVNRQNAKKGHKRTQANGSERKRTVANGSEAFFSLAKKNVRLPNDNDNDNDNENDYEYETDNDNDNDASLLTEEQRFDLVGRSSVESVETYISKILKWEAEKNKKCKDVYGTISKWIDEDKAKGRLKDDSPPSYDLDEYEQFAKSYDFSDAPWNAKEG